MITPPTCAEICDEQLGQPVYRESDASWRHGTRETQVFHRSSDNTYWQAKFRLSADGETNELREGYATITQVEPFEKTITAYRPVNTETKGNQ